MSRPRFHLTAATGNVNDPLGVTWDGARYHLFFQLNPDGPRWVPQCHWGQVDSTDLVRWEHPRTALAPDDADGPDHGCWSGAVAVADGTPVIVYTSVDAADLPRGRIALARGTGFGDWRKDTGPPVVDGPPPGLGVTHFRDPFVWRTDTGWRMVVGAGLADGSGAALQYSSPDLSGWTFDGVAATRSGAERTPVWTGTVWECPQLFALDGAWVLVVSVWSDDVTHHVAHAVGDYDGAVFTPRSWGRLLHGDSLYATTCFTDTAGRRCAISWSREADPTAPAGRTWAGALSVPHVLGLCAGGIVVTPHPDVDSLRTGLVADVGTTAVDGAPVAVDGVPEQADVVLTAWLPGPADRVAVALRGAAEAEPLRLVLDRAADSLSLERPGLPAQPMPLGAGGDGRVTVRALLDAGVVEVFTGAGAAGAVRVAPGADRLVATGSPGTRLDALAVFAMQRCFPA